jgi:hypothetical protein
VVVEKSINCSDCRKYVVCYIRKAMDDIGIDKYIHFHDCEAFDEHEVKK